MPFALLERYSRLRDAALNRSGLNGKANIDEELEFPLQVKPRIAHVDSGFRGVEQFSIDNAIAIAEYAPDALAISLEAVLALAEQKAAGLYDLPSLSVAIIVITGPGGIQLTDPHRDMIWRAFGVPVFEQFRGELGTIIARECEVHDGLHLDLAALPLPFEAEVTTDHCECGAETPRLMRTADPRARSAAA